MPGDRDIPGDRHHNRDDRTVDALESPLCVVLQRQVSPPGSVRLRSQVLFKAGLSILAAECVRIRRILQRNFAVTGRP